jgi:hypothetical protein
MNRTEYQFIWILDLKMTSDNDNDLKEDMINKRSMDGDMYSINTNGDEMKKVHQKNHSIYDSLVLLPNVKIVNHPTLAVHIGTYLFYYLFPYVVFDYDTKIAGYLIPRISVLMVITIMIYCFFHDIFITIIIIFIII